MKIARKTDQQRIEYLRKEIQRPEYRRQAIQIIASSLTEALVRNHKNNEN